jgi:hypothetical protein
MKCRIIEAKQRVMQFQASGFQDLHGGDSPEIRPSYGLPSHLTSHPSPYHNCPSPITIFSSELIPSSVLTLYLFMLISSHPFLLYSSCPPLSC